MVLPGVSCAKGSSAHQPLSCGITAGAGSFPRALRSHHLKVGVYMKKFLSVLLCLILFALPAAAHPGRTDSNGGHTDHSTGEYHYHHGQPAHQHIDGQCPYDFNETPYYNKSSSSSSSSKSETRTYYASKIKAERDAAEAEKAAAKQREKERVLTKVFVAIYFIAVFALSVYLAIADNTQRGIKKVLGWVKCFILSAISCTVMLWPFAIFLYFIYKWIILLAFAR